MGSGDQLLIAMNPTGIILVVALTAGLAVAMYSFLRRRVPEELFYYYRCAFCKRKFHYRRHQAGHKGKCPECKHPFTFPDISPKTP
jgi:DNA-directed RNA polymerase subunit RPC12/RpoP